jgi:hypothetical protein
VGLVKLLDLHLGRPLHRGGLSLFPVWNGRAVTRRGYDLNGSGVCVEERAGAPVVGELVVTNTGPRPALVLAGELLEGGRQHRVAAGSAIIDRDEAAVLQVRCVEEARWAGAGQHRRTGRRAPISLRGLDGQAAVWQRIRRYEQEYGAGSTHSVQDATRTVAAEAAALVADIRPLAFTCGVLVGIGGQPLLLEVFDSPRTLHSVWRELLTSAALDAVAAPAVATPGRRARRFLDRVVDVPVQTRPAGSGQSVSGRTPYAKLDALLWEGRAVHTVATHVRHELVSA